MNEWVNKLQYIHKMKYYPGNERNDIDTCNNLVKSQRHLLSKKSQSQKFTYCVLPFI